MIGLVKQSLFKATGGAYLINQELNKPTIDLYWKRNPKVNFNTKYFVVWAAYNDSRRVTR